jgi:hypothetical protein
MKYYTDALSRKDTHIKQNDTTQQLNISLGSVQSTVHIQLNCRKGQAHWVQKQFLFITKLVVQVSLIYLTHCTEQEEQFLQYTVPQDETQVHCTTPKTKKKHP